MASGDDRPAAVQRPEAGSAGLSRHKDAIGRKRFWWVEGPAGAVSFTLVNAEPVCTYEDGCIHARQRRAGWSRTPECWFLRGKLAWCAPSVSLGETFRRAFDQGEPVLWAELEHCYRELFGDD